jgi:hypothetical protein
MHILIRTLVQAPVVPRGAKFGITLNEVRRRELSFFTDSRPHLHCIIPEVQTRQAFINTLIVDVLNPLSKMTVCGTIKSAFMTPPTRMIVA